MGIVLSWRMEKIRYLGINAPEIAYEDRPSEPFGKEALIFNMKLVKRKKVRLETEKESHDCYGHLLAYVFLDSGTFVNEEMVKAGYAYVLFLNPNLKYNSRLLAAQRQAMRKKEKYMEDAIKKTAPYYLGNTSSHKFHRPDCEYGKKIFPSHLIIFKDKWDAYYEGYSPCRRCRP